MQIVKKTESTIFVIDYDNDSIQNLLSENKNTIIYVFGKFTDKSKIAINSPFVSLNQIINDETEIVLENYDSDRKIILPFINYHINCFKSDNEFINFFIEHEIKFHEKNKLSFKTCYPIK